MLRGCCHCCACWRLLLVSPPPAASPSLVAAGTNGLGRSFHHSCACCVVWCWRGSGESSRRRGAGLLLL